jgi:hypothetical protein
MPADRIDPLEDVDDRVHIDAASFAQIGLAWRAANGDELTHEGLDLLGDERIASGR